MVVDKLQGCIKRQLGGPEASRLGEVVIAVSLLTRAPDSPIGHLGYHYSYDGTIVKDASRAVDACYRRSLLIVYLALLSNRRWQKRKHGAQRSSEIKLLLREQQNRT